MQFSPPQRSLVFRALDEAEERTTGYYCFPPFRWERFHYDLLTQVDYGWEPLPDTILARTRCFQRINCSRPFDFFRIELNDRSILAAAERENLLENIYPLFVFILTHEMVHLIRLSSILDNWTKTLTPFDESEENRVQEISRRILTSSGSYQPIIDRFCTSVFGFFEPSSL
jgi:hypothetical protein